MGALEPGRQGVHPLPERVELPGEHLEQPAQVVARPPAVRGVPAQPGVPGAVQLGGADVAETAAGHDVQPDVVADREDVGGQHRRDLPPPEHPPADPAEPVVGVVHDLVGVVVRARGAGPAQAGGHRVGVGEEDDRGAPPGPADPRRLERVTEHRHQPTVRRRDGGPEVGPADAEAIGQAGTGDVADLVGGPHGDQRARRGGSVGEGGVEPPHPFGYTDLNRARLPFRHSPRVVRIPLSR